MINVMGAGAFGTALAISLSENGPVTLWSRDADHAAEMQATGRNDRRLPGVDLPKGLTVTNTLPLPKAKATLLAIPTQKLRDFLSGVADQIDPSSPLVLCCKGVELSTGKRPSEVVKDILPNAIIATLTGPSFAADIARGLPTALTLACDDPDQGAQLQSLLTTPNLRLYRSTDMIGAELGGALKNVIAIACGAAVGAGLGESARAALMTRGFAEMTRLAVKQGADPTTLNGLSGFGDLVLTCSSAQSRNYSFGQALGQGKRDESSATVEGVATAQAAHSLAQSLNIDLPITRAVTALCSGELQVDQAMDMLLSRPLKEE